MADASTAAAVASLLLFAHERRPRLMSVELCEGVDGQIAIVQEVVFLFGRSRD